MNECIYCKKREPQNPYCDSSPNDRHKLRVVPFDEQVRTTLIGKYWKQILVIGLILIAISYIRSCFGYDKDNSNNIKTTESVKIEKEKKITDALPSAPESETSWLIIEGKDIWVRSAPSTGEVIMKLNTGDKCEVLEKGKFEGIRDMYDYWYKIKFNNQVGWVYGSQSNLKTNYTYLDAVKKGLIDPH